jgi:ATP-dependent Clp protease protease subunit
MSKLGQTIYINFYDAITAQKVKAFMAVCTEAIQKFKPDTIYLCLSSPGGEVAAGITLYNFLRALPAKVVTHNIGAVDSICTVVFLAGEERFATPSASFLFHGVRTNFNQGASVTIYQLREIVSGLDEDHNKIVHVITSRTKLTEEEVRQLFSQGESKNSAFAESKGIVNAVSDLVIPGNQKLISLNMN